MKREIKREKTIPAFSIDTGELEVLWNRLTTLFENSERIYASIDINLPNENLEFSNIEELKQYSGLKGNIKNFSFSISQGNRRISIRQGFLTSQSVVHVTAENEAWCAGAIETTYSFLQSYKVWYHWFVSASIGWILLFLANTPLIKDRIFPTFIIDKTVIISWLISLVTLGFLYIFKGKLFAASVLRITQEDSFIRGHLAELSLFIALLTFILNLLRTYFEK